MSQVSHRAVGQIAVYTITAASLEEGHGALGAVVRGPARAMIQRRQAATPAPLLSAQLRRAQRSRLLLEQRAAAGTVPAAVREGLREYLACLSAWAAAIDESSDVALWAQDDNGGCQTGMLRRPDGSVLLWHTEEDTIGYFDEPRVVTFKTLEQERSAFLYPYLLPGPALGWSADQVHALDSLFVRPAAGLRDGVFTAVASWLIWRLAGHIAPRRVLLALRPFLDGSAINVAQRGRGPVAASTHEFGDGHVLSRALGQRPGALSVQVNAVTRRASRLGQIEALSVAERRCYAGRTRRMNHAVGRLGSEPQDLLGLLAERRGGEYANANPDVKAHCVAHITTAGVALYLQAGPAQPQDRYQPQWSAA